MLYKIAFIAAPPKTLLCLLDQMGNSLENYRAAIGIFNFHIGNPVTKSNYNSIPTYQEILLTNIRCTFLVVSLFILQSSNPDINIVFLLFVLYYILIIGNVELNPGPEIHNSIDTSTYRNDKTLSICNINIRSLRNKIEYIQNFTDEFDVVTLTETHLDSHVNDDELKLDSFSKKIIRKDRNRSGGGLLIYVKDYLIVQRKPELENYIDETLWVEIRGNGLSFLLCNTYRSDFSDGQYWAR